MEADEGRWQQLVEEEGLANATRLIMAEHPGQGDAVEDLAGIWGEMTVLEIYEAVLAERTQRTGTWQTTGLWAKVTEGANTLDLSLPEPVGAPTIDPCNSCPPS
jgi:hypothetical protein